MDYVAGQLGAPGDQQFCSNIVRVVVAGDSVTDRPLKSEDKKDSKVCVEGEGGGGGEGV